MEFKNLLCNIDSGVMTITINRPDKLNALNMETISEIGQAVQEGSSNADVRVMILTGAGSKAFIAGADILEFSNFTEAEGAKLARSGQEIFHQVERCDKPVIAAINGFALGGGLELAMACHLRIAANNAKFGQPEVKLGLTPGYGGTQRLPMLIGKTQALEFLLTADMIDAAEALRLGLVNYVTEPDQLLPKCHELAGKLMLQAPLALAGVIRSVNAYFQDGVDGYDTEIREFGKCFITADFKEGTAAFLEKRKANFKGT